MAIRMVFLDLNGTIVDDWPSSYAGVCAVFTTHGLPCPTLDEYIRFVALSGDYLSFYQAHGLAHVDREAIYNTYMPAYHGHANEVRVANGAYDVLETLLSLRIEVHIVTAAGKDLAEHLVEATRIRAYCENVHMHVHNKAAQVEAVIDGMRRVQRKECVMMGDLPSDVLHAKQARIHGIAYANPHVPRDIFSSVPGMDFAATSFDGLLTYIGAHA